MKKRLLLVLRLLIAGAGISYILLTLNWQDEVGVAAGTRLSDGRVLSEDASFVVVSGNVNLSQPTGPLQILIGPPEDDPTRSPVTMTLTEAMLSAENGPFNPQPGIATMLRSARADYLVYALLLLCLAYPLVTYRWGLLLRVRGMAASTLRRFRLVMIGAFFNFCMPGLTGGDVVKAYYVARHSDRRTDAIMTLVVDRVAGLLGLVLVAGVAGLFMLHDPVGRRVTIGIWSALVALVAAGSVYLTPGLRRWVGLDWLLNRLPGGGLWLRIDAAAVAYRRHKLALLAAVLVSVPVHLSTISAATLAGYALGMKVSFGLMLTVLPLLLLGGAVPLTYQGLGVMEWIGGQLLVKPPFVFFGQIVGMLLILRLCNVFYALFGSLFLLREDIHLHPPQLNASDKAGEAVGEAGASATT